MNFNEYQTKTKLTAKYPQSQAIEYLSLGLTSEAGEVAGKIKKIIRDGKTPNWENKVKSEIGDVLWYCARLADELGFELSEIADDNISKLLDRRDRGVIGGDGDNR